MSIALNGAVKTMWERGVDIGVQQPFPRRKPDEHSLIR
jgi:hypothetical protein